MSLPYVVEVNEGVVDATRQGNEWWLMYTARFLKTDRIVYTRQPCVTGGIAEVKCDDREHADWLAAHIVEFGGLPRTAVRVKQAAKVAAS